MHFLMVGHFVPEDGYVRFQGFSPETTRPLDRNLLLRICQKYGDIADLSVLPDEWHMTIQDGRITCDLLASSVAEMAVAADYAEQAGAVIVNLGQFSTMTVPELRRWTARTGASRLHV